MKKIIIPKKEEKVETIELNELISRLELGDLEEEDEEEIPIFIKNKDGKFVGVVRISDDYNWTAYNGYSDSIEGFGIVDDYVKLENLMKHFHKGGFEFYIED